MQAWIITFKKHLLNVISRQSAEEGKGNDCSQMMSDAYWLCQCNWSWVWSPQPPSARAGPAPPCPCPPPQSRGCTAPPAPHLGSCRPMRGLYEKTGEVLTIGEKLLTKKKLASPICGYRSGPWSRWSCRIWPTPSAEGLSPPKYWPMRDKHWYY